MAKLYEEAATTKVHSSLNTPWISSPEGNFGELSHLRELDMRQRRHYFPLISGLERNEQDWEKTIHPQESQTQQFSCRWALAMFRVGKPQPTGPSAEARFAHTPPSQDGGRGSFEVCGITPCQRQRTPILPYTDWLSCKSPHTSGRPYPWDTHMRGTWGGVITHQRLPRLIPEALHQATAMWLKVMQQTQNFCKWLCQPCPTHGRYLGIPIWPKCIFIHWTVCFVEPLPPRRPHGEDQQDVVRIHGQVTFFYLICLCHSFSPSLTSFSISFSFCPSLSLSHIYCLIKCILLTLAHGLISTLIQAEVSL